MLSIPGQHASCSMVPSSWMTRLGAADQTLPLSTSRRTAVSTARNGGISSKVNPSDNPAARRQRRNVAFDRVHSTRPDAPGFGRFVVLLGASPSSVTAPWPPPLTCKIRLERLTHGGAGPLVLKCSVRSPLPTGVLRSFVAPQQVRACQHPIAGTASLSIQAVTRKASVSRASDVALVGNSIWALSRLVRYLASAFGLLVL
jgi:hypothetical protein